MAPRGLQIAPRPLQEPKMTQDAPKLHCPVGNVCIKQLVSIFADICVAVLAAVFVEMLLLLLLLMLLLLL